MKFLRYKTVVILLLLSFSLKAQVPGYQGKRFLLKYNLGANINFNFAFDGPEKLSLAKRHTFSGNYVLGRKIMMGADATLGKIKVDEYFGSSQGKSLYVRSLHYTNQYGISMSIFNKQSLAPIGSYVNVGLFTAISRVVDTVRINLEPPIPIDVKYKYYGASLGFGKIRSLKKAAVMDIGINFTLSIPPSQKSLLLLSEYENKKANLSWEYLLLRHMVMFRLGIGGILF